MPSGRPKLKTLGELRQQLIVRDQNKMIGGKATNGNNLKVLKQSWKLRNLRLGEAILPEPSLSQKGGGA